MITLVSTQCRENYGSHDWDGKGECPQYWKNKGGETYILHGVPADLAHTVIGHSNDYSEELIINAIPYTGQDVWESWEYRTHITVAEDGSALVERLSGTTDLKRGLKSSYHSWEYKDATNMHVDEPTKYNVKYTFEDGSVANTEAEASRIFQKIFEKESAIA